jgi:hypothetical protein
MEPELIRLYLRAYKISFALILFDSLDLECRRVLPTLQERG